MTLAGAFVRSGKVRDLYEIDADRLLLVASDRLSAFDVVLPTVIPDKGRVLTGLSRFWFAQTGGIVANHLLSTDPAQLPADWTGVDRGQLVGRMMLCQRAEVVPIEAVVRGYLSGSGWKEYRATGSVCGIGLAAGLRESERLPAPIFTPATKAPIGEHDENIAFEEMARRVGGALSERIRDAALRLYAHGAAACEAAGIILADSKFEFGLLPDGTLLLIDEVLTPDSSRFWDAASYEPGRPQASFDKQFVRDWLEAQAWDKTAPGPELPDDIVAGTRERYVAAFERITGASFPRYLEEDVVALMNTASTIAGTTATFRFAVNVTPKPGILDPQGRAVEQSLPHLGLTGVFDVRVGRRVELSVESATETEARAIVERLAGDLLSNPLIETYAVELVAATSSTSAAPSAAPSPNDEVSR